MTATRASTFRLALTSIAAVIVLLLSNQPLISQGPQVPRRAPQIPTELRDRAAREGRVRVIVELNVPGGRVAEGSLPEVAARLGQRQRIAAAQTRMLSRLRSTAPQSIRRFETIPYVALEVDSRALDALESSGGDVLQVMEDRIVRPVLADSVPIIQGDQAWDVGYDGTGTTVAVLDTGVDSTHPFLAGKVIEEACYSGGDPSISSSFCPNGQTQQIGPGSATPCLLDGCYHGTHVAGIAAGNGTNDDQPFSGVAKGADIMAVQVFSQIDSVFACGFLAPCLGGFTSDIIAGLERVYTVAPQLNIVSVNMSLGEGQFFAPCNNEPYKPIIDNLRSIGVATVVASGNDGYTSSMMTPACVPSAVSVGATDKTDYVTYFSNVAPFLSLFAPGDSITSSMPLGDYDILSGTSMATPHVAGAWAVLKQAMPAASVATILNALRQTGLPITDTRGGSAVTIPRVRVFQALGSLTAVTNPAPVLTSLSPPSAHGGLPSLSLTVIGSGFNTFSVVRWNGIDRATTVISATKLRITLSAADLATEGTAEVSVFMPEPGGGTSLPFTFTITPPATLTVSAPEVTPSSSETVTLNNAFGGPRDWLALAATSAADTNYIQWTYVSPGVTTATWTVNMPATPGTYEFRYFLDDRYIRVATSPAITVVPTPNRVPVVSALTPNSTMVGGQAFTLTVTGTDFISGSVVRWNGADRPTTFASSTQLRATINAADIAAVGTAQVTVFTPAPGGGTSAALPFTISPRPTLTVSANNVPGGAPVTVTMTDGLGGTYDWLALASTSAPDTSYLQWIYVGAGVTTRTWTVNMPGAGTYEFRLFLNAVYTRAATSPPVTVTASQPPSLTVSSTTAVGGASITLTMTNGTGSASDWLTLAATGSPDTSYLQTTYVGAGVTTRTWTVTMPMPPGTYEFRYFPGGYPRTATSPIVTVTAAQPPALSVSAVSATVGTPVTVTLTNGGGGASDWLTLAVTGSANTSYLQWIYVGTGVTTRTWTVNMPMTPGTYEFRYFPNGGYTLAATSPMVTVNAAPPPALSVSATSVTTGAPVTVTLTNGPGGGYDWLALASTTAPNTSYIQWIYVGAGVTTRTWTVNMPMTVGTYEFRFFLNGGYTRAATSPVVTVGS